MLHFKNINHLWIITLTIQLLYKTCRIFEWYVTVTIHRKYYCVKCFLFFTTWFSNHLLTWIWYSFLIYNKAAHSLCNIIILNIKLESQFTYWTWYNSIICWNSGFYNENIHKNTERSQKDRLTKFVVLTQKNKVFSFMIWTDGQKIKEFICLLFLNNNIRKISFYFGNN